MSNILTVKRSFYERFETLNTYSGIEFIKANPLNVAYPNRKFTPPANGSYFELNFLPPALTPGLFTGAQNSWSGVFQIDIVTPLNKGEAEADNKYLWIARLFSPGTSFEDVYINRTYKAQERAEENSFRTIVRIEYDARADKE